MQITKMLLTRNEYSRPGMKLQKVTKVAVHYTGNPGSTAKGNRDYFESLKNGGGRYVSSHYVVGLQGEVIQCIPETEWSYCTNQANGYSVSIETCHPDATGKFNAVTEAALVELAADICKRHGLDPEKDVIRHYDVTGKKCPLWYVNHPEDWKAFKGRVKTAMSEGLNGWQDRAGKWYYYKAGKPLKGQWIQDGGWYYWLDRNGVMATGAQKIEGKVYFLNRERDNNYKIPKGACIITDDKGALNL